MGERHSGGPRQQSWRGGPDSPRQPKGGSKIPDRDLNPTYGYDEDGNPARNGRYCWCGDQHDKKAPNPEHWSPGTHPWPIELGED